MYRSIHASMSNLTYAIEGTLYPGEISQLETVKLRLLFYCALKLEWMTNI